MPVRSKGEIEPDPEDLFYRFDLSFRDAQVYLRVRPKRPPAFQPDVKAKLKELEWQLREKPQQAHSLLKNMAQNLGTTPNSITDPSEKALARAYGDMWVGLPAEVRRLLVQAQFFSSFLHQVAHDDWSAVVNDYARALETLLRRRLGRKLDDKGLRPKRNKSFARATIGEFCELFQRPQFAQLAPAVGLSGSSLMAEMASDICTVANWRNPADHGAQLTSPATAIKLRGLLLGTPEQRVGLLWKINSL